MQPAKRKIELITFKVTMVGRRARFANEPYLRQSEVLGDLREAIRRTKSITADVKVHIAAHANVRGPGGRTCGERGRGSGGEGSGLQPDTRGLEYRQQQMVQSERNFHAREGNDSSSKSKHRSESNGNSKDSGETSFTCVEDALGEAVEVVVAVIVTVTLVLGVFVRVVDVDFVIVPVADSEIVDVGDGVGVFDSVVVPDCEREPEAGTLRVGVRVTLAVAVADDVTVLVTVLEPLVLLVVLSEGLADGEFDLVTVAESLAVEDTELVTDGGAVAVGEGDCDSVTDGVMEKMSAGYTAEDSACAITSTRTMYLNASTPGADGEA